MLLCPIQNTAKFRLEWVQDRPRLTQTFGVNPQIYAQFGLKGHNGVDWGVPVGTPIFSPIEGIASVGDDGTGYGKYIKIRKDNLEVTLGHLSHILITTGMKVFVGEKVGKSGNTGFSTGPHLHMTVKRLSDGQVLNQNNGFCGAIDFLDMIITWKGGFNKSDF